MPKGTKAVAGLVSVKGLYVDILSRSAALSGSPRLFTGSFDDVIAQRASVTEAT